MTHQPSRLAPRRPAALGAVALGAVALLLAACTGPGGIATAGPATQPPSSSSSNTQAPSSDAPASEVMATPAPMFPILAVGEHPTLGMYIVDGEGKSLYLFTEDEDDASSCSGDCAEAWPPFLIDAGLTPEVRDGVTGTVGVIERDDGGLQVTYEKQPLYYFSGDSEPGDTTGHGSNEVWYLVSPEGDSVSTGGRGNY
jgi:predicted lipoprotein with Yx(FWY)xxD motif